MIFKQKESLVVLSIAGLWICVALLSACTLPSLTYRFTKEARKDAAAIKARVKKPYPPDSDRVGQEDALYYNGDRYEAPAEGWDAARKNFSRKD